MMKKYLYIALAAAALTGCSSDEAIEMVEQKAIAFDNVFVNNATRATDLNKDNIQNFGVYGSVAANNTQGMIFENTNVYKEGAAFKYNNTQYWIAKAQYDFAAIAPYQNGEDATWTYTTNDAKNGTLTFNNATAEADQDLLFAYKQPALTADAITSQPAPVAFDFYHMLSRVQLTFVNAIPASSNIELKVSEVKIKDTYNEGTLTVTNGAVAENWTVTSTDNTMEIAFANADAKIPGAATGVTNYQTTEHHYLIPANDTYTVSFKVQLFQAGANLGTYPREATVALNLAKGNSYNVKATLTAENVLPNTLCPIEFTVNTVDSWENYTDVNTGTPYTPASN